MTTGLPMHHHRLTLRPLPYKRSSFLSACVLALAALAVATPPVPAAAATQKAVVKPKIKKSTAKNKKKLVVAAAVAAPLLAATAEQLRVAQHVLTGNYDCEFGKSMHVNQHPEAPGYFSLLLDKREWIMKPLLTSTGTIRLEDVKGQALLLQILTKSMLMDTKVGRRLVDGCVHASQRANEERLRDSPPTSNF